ncbi:hypothetical protein P3T73_15920 [Kiritimatiellota bacterium B12222]|nr:hypothetical protein P3T73_15920 [Kiritimatiellota bacterium B12222]
MNPSLSSINARRFRTQKSGQTLIFMTLVIVMLAFAALFYFDVHKILHVKAISRNGGDAAALAGARWQAISLNLIGSLNIAEAVAITNDLSAGQTTSPEADLIAELQRRIAFSGPILGYVSAQQAAKQNGIFNQSQFASEINTHVNLLRTEYGLLHPEPFQPSGSYASAWEEVADMMELASDHGVAVQAAWQYYATYSNYDHLLLNPGFYDAIAGRSWCWMYYNAFDELQNYQNWTYWDDLPSIQVNPPVNAEILSLWLQRVAVRDSIPLLPTGDTWESTLLNLQAALDDLNLNDPVAWGDFDASWAFYNPNRWDGWSDRIPDDFPWDGEIRDEYDYGGADAAMAVRAETERHTEFRGADTINWTAGAKPFGSLEGNVPPNTYGLILPAYTDIRLIPVDASISGGNGALRPGWLDFIINILPAYMNNGPSALPQGNWYADQLRTWEDQDYRQDGLEWLLDNNYDCYRPTGGGPGSSGGTFHGH